MMDPVNVPVMYLVHPYIIPRGQDEDAFAGE
jgi:hypothetical protein